MVAVRDTAHHKWKNGDNRTNCTRLVPHTLLRWGCGSNHKNDSGPRRLQHLGKQDTGCSLGSFYFNFLVAVFSGQSKNVFREHGSGLLVQEGRQS